MSYVVTFLGGALFGAAVVYVRAWWLYKKELKQLEKRKAEATARLNTALEKLKESTAALTQAQTPALPGDTVKDRLRKAVEITIKQSSLDVRGDHDKKHEYNNLELEKLTILKSILADGHDPHITIRYDSGDREMLLSTYVQSLQRSLN